HLKHLLAPIEISHLSPLLLSEGFHSAPETPLRPLQPLKPHQPSYLHLPLHLLRYLIFVLLKSWLTPLFYFGLVYHRSKNQFASKPRPKILVSAMRSKWFG